MHVKTQEHTFERFYAAPIAAVWRALSSRRTGV